jgi:hypothetical protein
MKNIKLFFLFTIFLVSQVTSSQNYFSKIISENFTKYSEQDYSEKMYVHTDKNYYATGDHIWFSAYLVNGISHQKSKKSYVAYVELINDRDSLVDRKKIFINNISSPGDFKLSKKLKSGTYKIRAYTNYMRNEDANYFFKKEITIWSSDDKKNTPTIGITDTIFDTSNEYKPDLNFYPQGGYLVNNLLNKVGIKLKSESLNDIKIIGVIKDENNKELSNFSIGEFGLGEFTLTPTNNKTYYAFIEKDGITYKYKLPKALEKGYVLNVINNQKELLIDINSTSNNGILGTSLVIHQRGKLVFNEIFKEAKNKKILKIPIHKLNSGVLHISLFNSNSLPVCERLVFVENNIKKTVINIEKPKSYFGNRKKVTLKINVDDLEKKGIPSKLSMTVRDINASPNNVNKENIKTWLLLNSDIRGKIENPSYFFENKNVRKRQYLLDLLMLTHGWRRFTWQEIIENKRLKPKYNVEKGITISGKTLEMKSPHKLTSVPTRLTFMSKIIEQEPIKNSNINGEYSYGPYIFFDSIPVILEARLTNFTSKKNRDRKVLIIPDNNNKRVEILPELTSKNKIKSKKEIDAHVKFQRYLKEINAKFKQSENVLNEIIVKSKLKSKDDLRNDEMNSRTSYGNAFNRFDANEEQSSTTALNLFYGVPGVRVYNDSIYIARNRNVSPLILYDESPIDIIDLSSIPASEVSFIDILTDGDAAIFSSNGAVISIYSKQGNGYDSSRNIERKPGIIDYKAAGFYQAKEFYVTDHLNGLEEQTRADNRTTLHWEPTIITSGKAPIEVSFYTSDADSKYLIEVEGITSTGIPLYKTTEIVVD